MTRIIVNDWMMSMGATAFMRIDKQTIQSNANSIDVSYEWLEALPEKLFAYLMQTYSISTREEEVLNRWINGAMAADKKERYQNFCKRINERVKSYADRVKKYFPEYVEDLTITSLDVKMALESRNGEELQQAIQRYLDILSIEEVNQKLTLNWVKPTILSASGGQVSFLNVLKNSATYKEHISLFRKDFIEAILWEVKLRDYYVAGDEEGIVGHMKSDTKPDYVAKWVREQKKSKQTWCEWLADYPACSLIDGQWGTIPFEEKHFVPLGLAMMSNNVWDGDYNAVQHISSLARLILFLSPLGCNRYRRQINGQEQKVFGFLHDETNCEYTYELNQQVSYALKKEALFTDALKDTFSTSRELERRRKNITMLIEWETDYSMKKTLLEYKPLNQKFVSFVLNSHKLKVSSIYPYSFKEEMVRSAIDNRDSKHLIIKEFKRILSEPASSTYSIYTALKMREQLEEGGEEAVVTERMYKLGWMINQRLASGRKENKDGSYQASSEKKLTTIVYRLLNAAKGGNRQVFFDSAIRLHVLANMNVSKDFTKLLDSETSDKEFATIALAFIAGLTPSNDYKKDEEIVQGGQV